MHGLTPRIPLNWRIVAHGLLVTGGWWLAAVFLVILLSAPPWIATLWAPLPAAVISLPFRVLLRADTRQKETAARWLLGAVTLSLVFLTPPLSFKPHDLATQHTNITGSIYLEIVIWGTFIAVVCISHCDAGVRKTAMKDVFAPLALGLVLIGGIAPNTKSIATWFAPLICASQPSQCTAQAASAIATWVTGVVIATLIVSVGLGIFKVAGEAIVARRELGSSPHGHSDPG